MTQNTLWRGHGSYSTEHILMEGAVKPPSLTDFPLTGELFASARHNTIDEQLVCFTGNIHFAVLYALKESGCKDEKRLTEVFDFVFPGEHPALKNVRDFFRTRTFHSPTELRKLRVDIRRTKYRLEHLRRKLDGTSDAAELLTTHVQIKALAQRLAILQNILKKLETMEPQKREATFRGLKNQFPVLMGFREVAPLRRCVIPIPIPQAETLELAHQGSVDLKHLKTVLVPPDKVEVMQKDLSRRSLKADVQAWHF